MNYISIYNNAIKFKNYTFKLSKNNEILKQTNLNE